MQPCEYVFTLFSLGAHVKDTKKPLPKTPPPEAFGI